MEANFMNFFEKTLTSKTVYSGTIFKVKSDTVSLPNHKTAKRELVLKSNAACVVALTKSKKIVLVKQFRHAVKQCLWEIPAGKKDPGESPFKCAKRELLEETGFKSKHWLNLGPILPTPGFCNESIFTFLALNAFKACQPCTDPDEFVKTGLFDFKKIVQQATFGNLTDAKSVCAILRTHLLFLNNKLSF